MTREEAYTKLLDTVENDFRHQDYDRVVALADYYRMLITGKDIEKELRQFNPREDDVMFEQRKRLTIPITTAVASSIKKPFNKVPRTPAVTRKVLGKTDNDKESIAEVEERIKKFYGSDDNVGGLDYFLQNRFVDLTFKDPNAWIVIGFDEFDRNTEKPEPHPAEISAEEAVNFSMKNNQVEWLVTLTKTIYQERADNGKLTTKTGKTYTIYAQNDAWTFVQVSDDTGKRILQVPDSQLITIQGRGTYVVTHFQLSSERVPAFRVGYIPDILFCIAQCF